MTYSLEYKLTYILRHSNKKNNLNRNSGQHFSKNSTTMLKEAKRLRLLKWVHPSKHGGCWRVKVFQRCLRCWSHPIHSPHLDCWLTQSPNPGPVLITLPINLWAAKDKNKDSQSVTYNNKLNKKWFYFCHNSTDE